MLGSASPRMLSIALPHIQSWNIWFSLFGNTAEGFAAIRATVDAACATIGRDPASVEATAAVFVQLPTGGGRIMGSDGAAECMPITGSAAAIAEQLAAFAAAGAAHLQLVVDPITNASIESLGEVLALLDAM